jgi:hypothetical protein
VVAAALNPVPNAPAKARAGPPPTESDNRPVPMAGKRVNGITKWGSNIIFSHMEKWWTSFPLVFRSVNRWAGAG